MTMIDAEMIRSRTREGVAVAKAKGRLKGRGPTLTAKFEQLMVAGYRAGDHTVAELAEQYGMGGRGSVVLDRAKAKEVHSFALSFTQTRDELVVGARRPPRARCSAGAFIATEGDVTLSRY